MAGKQLEAGRTLSSIAEKQLEDAGLQTIFVKRLTGETVTLNVEGFGAFNNVKAKSPDKAGEEKQLEDGCAHSPRGQKEAPCSRCCGRLWACRSS